MSEDVDFILLDVDTQKDFIHPEGKLYAKGSEAILEPLLRFKVSAIKHGIPIVSSVCAHSENDPEFEQYPPHCIVGTEGQRKVPESETGLEFVVPNDPDAKLPPADAPHIVLEKQDFPIFTNRHAEAILESLGKKVAVVYGVVTEVCVRAAALGLLERGWRVCVVQDAVWPIDERTGKVALKAMQDAGVEVMSSAHVLKCLGAVGSDL